MLKIGEFSKRAHLTVKALRFYEKEGILMPASIDKWTGYRYYETEQLLQAAAVKSYRQLGLSLEEIKAILAGADAKRILAEKAEQLAEERNTLDLHLSIIQSILEEHEMTYQVTEKTIPECIVYSAETVLSAFSDIMNWIPSVGEACLRLNPEMKCTEPPYEFCEYPDGEPTEKDVRVRHSEAVTAFGKEDDRIHFRTLPETKVLSVYHKGPYETLGRAYAYLLKYAESGGYEAVGLPRESYIDGIWNKETPEEWLTEVQLPIR